MAAHMGAHETMELHEVLNSTIDCINLMQLYRPYVKDQRLLQIVDRQLQFITNDYNMTVQSLAQQGRGQAVPYRAPMNAAPVYGLDNPAQQSPNLTVNQMDDRDVACGLLGCHKSSASMKMIAALECADPQLRRMMQQSAVNCSELAYEVWQYMNQAGYYQVPTMKEMTTNTVLSSYQTTGNMMHGNDMAQGQQQSAAPMQSYGMHQ
ncbi:spore coat protein [Paenibacillus arenilitoris]|uniref:Spore coat protein n=1 Tax=Paenibacillus arenilitoris TaxID=2772299 RepID=A0A927CGN2_9BACL|nr:spore coat protein [Paenibacillus arenilitoris]MBD2867748.1 spore coat protein [Paenibacillus arenilitoris]